MLEYRVREPHYKTIAKETAGILKGEYGRTPAPVNAELQARVLEGGEPITDRPADHIEPEITPNRKIGRASCRERV